MNIQKIYWGLPSLIKDLAASARGYLISSKRFNSHYYRILSQIDKQQYSDKDSIALYQLTKLKELALEVIEFTPYYQGISGQNEEILTKIKSATSISEILDFFPIINKKDLIDYEDAFLNQNPQRKVVEIAKTSGTTGAPLTTYYDAESIAAGFAMWSRFHNWIGLPPKPFRTVRFSGNQIIAPNTTAPPFWVHNFSEKQLLMSAYHLTEKNAKHYVEKINSFCPKLIDGYPSSIKVLSKYIISKGIKFATKPYAIVTTAETLIAEDREIIERAFGCKVFNQYASSDGAPFITECPNGKLHINVDTGVFEFLNERGEPALPGEMGELVVTSFRCYKSPKVRFRIGDWVKLSENKEECTCGSFFPVVDEIVGRTEDLVIGMDGRRVGMLNYNLLKYSEGIKEAQIQQTKFGEIAVIVVKDLNYQTEKAEKYIKERAEILLGKGIKVSFSYTEKIPISSRGKFKAVVCKINSENFNNVIS